MSVTAPVLCRSVDLGSPRRVDVSTTSTVGTCTVSVCGEVDTASAPELRADLLAVLHRPDLADDVLIDLRQVGFLGAAGLAVIATARQTAFGTGRTVRLRCGSNRAVIRPLQITGLWTSLDSAEG